MLIVQKFGGSSVANKDRLLNAAGIIADAYRNGNSVVAVLSAQGDTTDILLEKAAELSPSPSKREVDMLLAIGEQQSAALMSIALINMGLPAVSLNAHQIRVRTTHGHGNARISGIDGDRLRKELAEGKIVLVTGFQGINNENDITTLGRGGSDTSAVAIAALLNADVCDIYTDVDGVFTADPRIVKNARKLDRISYGEMLEMANLGAQVLHNRSVEMAKLYGVNLRVRSSLTKKDGTSIVGNTDKMVNNRAGDSEMSGISERRVVVGVAGDLDVCAVFVRVAKDNKGSIGRLFSLLAEHDINVDIITLFTDVSFNEINFTVSKTNERGTVDTLNEHKEELGIQSVKTDKTLAKVSIVGAGMESDPGVAAAMFETIYGCGSDIFLIATSEIKLSVLVKAEDYIDVMNAVHERFIQR